MTTSSENQERLRSSANTHFLMAGIEILGGTLMNLGGAAFLGAGIAEKNPAFIVTGLLCLTGGTIVDVGAGAEISSGLDDRREANKLRDNLSPPASAAARP